MAAIHVGRAAVIRGADLAPTIVADAGLASLVVGFDDDVGELLRRGQPAERFEVDLISFVTRGRRLVEDTGRDLKILRGQRREHVAGGEIVGRRLVRVEPDAHRIFATALELHVADARQAREHVLDVQGRVVRQIERVARLVRRVEVNGQQDAGYGLADLHAQALNVLWQAREYVLYPVLRQHLRDVEVGADRERDGYGEIAIPGRLAVHVEHILDAVDLLFERRCDGAGDGLSGCAGIGCRDLHRRRDDFWILGDRKNRERAQTKRRHKDAEHGGEARAIDEEMCQAHVADSDLAVASRRGGMDPADPWRDFFPRGPVRNVLHNA